jgi:hypothetical protein
MARSTNEVGGRGAARTRLYLGEAGAAVTAQIAHRSEGGLTVRRALPFLRLASEVVDEEGRAATIASVRVDVEDDVPTLHMELVYPTRPARRDVTLPYGFATVARPEMTALPRARVRADDTLVFSTAAEGEAGALALPPRGLVGRLFRSRWSRYAAVTLRAVRALLARLLRRLEPSLP